MTNTTKERPAMLDLAGPIKAARLTPAPAAPSARGQLHPVEQDHPVRVVVADDHQMYREGIVRALAAAGMVVLGEADDGAAALARIHDLRPDVALVDVSMPGLDGIDVVAALARQSLEVPVVLLSAFGDEELVVSGLQAGAASYVSKTADREEIIGAIVAAADPAMAPHRLAGRPSLGPQRQPGWIPHLTLQEYTLLRMARAGDSKAQMAAFLGLDEPTVRRGLSAAIGKIGAETLPEALEIAVENGILR